MASGDKLQIVLEARDEMTQEISKVRKSLKGLEAEQSKYAKEVEAGNTEAADSYETVRREIQDQKLALERLRAEQRMVASEGKKLVAEETRARVQARMATKQQAQALQGVAALTARVTGNVRVQTRAWDVLKMKVAYAASQFKARWTAAISAVSARMDTLRGKLASSGAGNALRYGAMGAGLAGVGLATIGVKTASQLEQSQISLEQLMGSAKKAGEMMDWLKATAASTPFELSGLTTATQKLLAYGFSAKQARANLMVIGDAASATGLGQEGIDRVTTALGQMQAKQKISGEEMLQLTEAGIPAWQMLADKMGMSVAELQAMVQLPGGGAAVFSKGGLPKLIDAMGEKYDGLMNKQSQTLGGLWSTLKDTVALAAADLINKYLPQIKAAMKGMISGAGAAFDFVKRTIDFVGPTIERVVNFISQNKEAFIAGAAAIGVMTVAMGALAIATNATGIPAIIFAIGALVGLLVMAYKRVDWFRAAVDGAFKWIRQAVAWFVDWFKTYAVPVIKVYLKVWWFYLSRVVWPVVRTVFKAIGLVVKVFVAYLTKVFWPAVRGVFRAFIGAARGLWQGAKASWDRVVGIFRGAKERIGSILTGIKSFFSNLWSGLTDGLPAAIDTMKQWLSKIPGLGAILDGLLFTGGPVMAGGTYGVGELGPELFVPKSGSPFMVGEHGPEVRDFTTSGFVVPNHLLDAVGGSTTTMVRERVIERESTQPLVGQMIVRDDREAVRELERMQQRQRRLERERV